MFLVQVIIHVDYRAFATLCISINLTIHIISIEVIEFEEKIFRDKHYFKVYFSETLH